MQNVIAEKRTIGLNFLPDGTAKLIVWAPFSKKVQADIKGKVQDMERGYQGYWFLDKISLKSGDRYNLVLDGKTLADPASLSQPEGVHSYSEAVKLESYEWNDQEWKGVHQKNLIIYELHTGTFTPQGTFEEIANRLGYLKSLGITAIEIMPVAQFPGSRNWGYDGVYPFAVQKSYGGAQQLQKLVDACHQQGIAVILDVVYNHLGPEGNYLSEFGPYFTDKYKTPWGKAINFDDAWCDGVRRFFIENALMWFRDFHIDGLRLDAVHAIKDFSAKHILQEIKEWTDKLDRKSSFAHFLICESDLNDVRFITSPDKGGYGMDATWNDEFHHAIHSLVTGERNGYYEDFGTIHHLVKAFEDAYVYDGTYSYNRKRTFGSKTTGIESHKFVIFSQNHDQVGNRMLGERLTALTDFETLKIITGAVFISPYIPLLFMGEEYAETKPFLYFTSHSDQNLIHLVREGRKNEFMAFMKAGEPPDPQAQETFEASKLTWQGRSPKQEQMFAFYQELIKLRNIHPIWRNSGRTGLKTFVAGDKALVVKREFRERILWTCLNFGEQDVLSAYPGFAAQAHVLLNSSEKKWGGPEKSLAIEGQKVMVPGKTMLVLSDLPV